VKHLSELTQRVLEQTKARVLQGDTHHPDKVLSVFETHTEAIRKGKKVKPTEFGKLVKIQEAESQFITDYQVCAVTNKGRRRPGSDAWRFRPTAGCRRGGALIKSNAGFVGLSAGARDAKDASAP
jgi:hypothetical protein